MRYSAPGIEVTRTTTSPRPFFSRATEDRTPPRPTHSIPSHHTTWSRPCLSTSACLQPRPIPAEQCNAIQRLVSAGSLYPSVLALRSASSASLRSCSRTRRSSFAVWSSFVVRRPPVALCSRPTPLFISFRVRTKKILQDRLTWRGARFREYSTHFCLWTLVCDPQGLMLRTM